MSRKHLLCIGWKGYRYLSTILNIANLRYEIGSFSAYLQHKTIKEERRMKAGKETVFSVLLLVVILITSCADISQQLTGASANPNYKYSTPMPPGIASPDKVETRFGTLKFFDGFPDNASAKKLFDNLDFQRAVQAYLLALPAVNQAFNRKAILSMGPVNETVPIWENLVDARTIELTANDNTPYTWFWIDLHKGPLVIEVPPKVLGLVDDMWYRWVVDLGITGLDKGEGGRYLFLPPGYKGTPPQGYEVVLPQTFSNVVIWRSFLVDGDPKPGVNMVKKFTKIYPLEKAANPPKLTFVDMSGKPFSMVNPANYPSY
jgi:hypothetical protein